MEDNSWALSLSDKAAKIISNSDLLINSDGKNCFAIHSVANTLFSNVFAVGRGSMAVYVFFTLAKGLKVLHSSSKAHNFSS